MSAGVPIEHHILKDMNSSVHITDAVTELPAPSHDGPAVEIKNNDDINMTFFGKRQQLKRRFGFMSIIGLTCTLMITWEGILSVFALGLSNGGPASMIYGYLIVWIGTIAQALSMAEMASMIPLCGGQYNWVAVLAPPSVSKYLSYLTGWVAMIGWQAATTSSTLLAGQMIQGIAVLNYPDYTPKHWQTTLLFYAMILFALFVNTYLANMLPAVEGMIFIIHLLGFVAILFPLVYLSPHGDMSLFNTFMNEGGWSNQGLSSCVGIISSVFALLGMDAAAHMSEEVHNAAVVVPRSILATVAINGSLGFAMVIAILFCMGDITEALESTTGFPFIEIFYQATQSTGGATVLTAIVIVAQISAAIGLLATSSRMTWAFAREKGIPGYKYFSRVEPRTALPLWAIGLSVSISLVLGLLNIASVTALNAVVSLVAAGIYSSYLFPSIVMVNRRLSKPNDLRFGPFTLGKYGTPINIFSIVYTVFIIFFSFWPMSREVSPETMNWSVLVFGSVLILSTLFWFAHGRKVYTGPITEAT